jgi:hypothetical protein
VDPRQQVRIVGAVRGAVGQGAVDVGVNHSDLGDQPLGLGGAAIGGAADELGGALQAAERVLPPARMVPDAGKRPRMEHLQEQRGDAAGDHRREVAVHPPGGRAGAEQARVTRGIIEVGGPFAEADEAVDLGLDRALEERHGAPCKLPRACDQAPLLPRNFAAEPGLAPYSRRREK